MDFRRERALSALIESRTIAEAADRAGVSASTLYRYTSEPEFRGRLRAVSRTALAEASRRLSAESAEAVNVIAEIMTAPNTPAQVRLNAADRILQHAARLTERTDMLERLAELEGIVFDEH